MSKASTAKPKSKCLYKEHLRKAARTKAKADASESHFDIAKRHLGIISKRCLFWYRFLPQPVRNYYDPEDMIGDAVVHILRVGRKYSSAKGKESTWVWHTTDNFCLSKLSHYRTKQYTACATIELTPEVSNHIASPSYETKREAVSAVERVIERSSDAVLNLIEALFDGSIYTPTIRDFEIVPVKGGRKRALELLERGMTLARYKELLEASGLFGYAGWAIKTASVVFEKKSCNEKVFNARTCNESVVKDFRRTIKECSATFEDFQIAYRYNQS